MAHHHRTSSTSSEVFSSETVSYMQRWVFAHCFRSQRHIIRLCIGVALLFFILYTINPFGSSVNTSHLKINAESRSEAVATRSVSGGKNPPPDSEYRATYFEEMAKRIARKNLTFMSDFHSSNELRKDEKTDFHPSNGLGESEEKKDTGAAESKVDLGSVMEKVKKMALLVSECHEVPGMSIVLVKGKTSAKIPLGMANVEAKRPVTTNTKFLLNSISKTFLGQLLAVIISDSTKNVTFDTRVADILGSDFQLATEELTKEVTLRDLMSHRTGLSSGNLGVCATFPPEWTVADVVKNLKHLPPSTPFRTTFLYSNLASMLTVHIAETLGGASWDKLLVKRLLEPLGMTSTIPVTSVTQMETKAFSAFYVPVEGKLVPADTRIFDLGPILPLSAVTSTATDMAKWLQFNLARGRLPNGRQLINSNLWSAMWTRQVQLSPMFLANIDKSADHWPIKDRSEGYGLYWFINKYRGLTNYWHGGGLYSHYTLAWHFPDRDVALYAVINGYSSHSRPFSVVENLAYYAADLLLGVEPWLDEKSLCSFQKPLVASVEGAPIANKKEESLLVDVNESKGKKAALNESHMSSKKESEFPAKKDETADGAVHSLEKYKGLFHNPLFGLFIVIQNPKTDVLECHMRALTGILHPKEGHTFGVELTQSLRFLSKPSEESPTKQVFQVTFVEDKSGGITDVDIHSTWPMEVPIRFHRKR